MRQQRLVFARRPCDNDGKYVLSSGVAGTMAANRTGLQWATVRNPAMAWIFTLPASILLLGTLFWALRHLGS